MRRVALVLLLTALLTACGGSSGGGQPAGSTKVSLSEFKFTPASLDVKAGKVVLYLVNEGSVSHDFVLTDSSGKQVAKSELVQPGNSALLTIDSLAAGSYTFFCDVPGHRDSGMEGKLTAG